MYSNLPKIELWLYFLCWVGGVGYSIYNIFLTSNMYGEQLGADDLETGWSWIGRKKDVADYEWSVWLPFLRQLAPWLLLHFAVSEIFRWIRNQTLLQIWFVLVTLAFCVAYVGTTVSLLLVVQPCLLLLALHLGGRSGVWLISLPIIMSLNFYQGEMLTDDQHLVVAVCIAWMHLRAISFCMDQTDGWNGGDYQILSMLAYSLYLPLMFLGPLVLYRDFQTRLVNDNNASLSSLQKRISCLICNLARYLGWMILTEWALHYIYCNAIQLQHEVLPYLDAWTLNGLAYCVGQFFLNKYVVIYGLMGTLAEGDGFKAPPPPRCIAHISLYSDMWRYFDRGFYDFLVSYVYGPLMRYKSQTWLNNYKTLHRLMCSMICFSFVYIWHGLSDYILVWSICNFLGVTIEAAGRIIASNVHYLKLEEKLSETNKRRWRAFVSCPLFIMSAYTMFYFFGGMEVGAVFMQQLFKSSLTKCVTMLFFAYCMCQVSIEIKLKRGEFK